MDARDLEPQLMRDGNRCEPREILRDYLDGGSAIINRVDQLWPPIGRLCATLRRTPTPFPRRARTVAVRSR